MAKKKQNRKKSGGKNRNKVILVTGRFSAAAGGFGFIAPEQTEDSPDHPHAEYFVPPHDTCGALDGDLVEAAVTFPDKNGRIGTRFVSGPVGSIQRILERGRSFVVAQLDSRRTARPLNKHLPEQLIVNDVPRSVRTGEWVRLRLLKDGSKHTEKLRTSVERGLGQAGTVQADLAAIAAEYQLEPAYSETEEAAAEKLEPMEIPRKDLTELFTVTIDPADAHDFDDAVSIGAGGRNELLLGVHIADVATWIKQGSKFDKCAEKRSFSAYLPGMFLPMLPKRLTAKISLREGVDSPAHSVLFRIRKSDGKILSAERMHSTVRVNARLTFEQVQKFIDNPKSAPKKWDKTFREHLSLLTLCAQRMRQYRFKHEKFLNIDTAEVRVMCDEATFEIKGLERRTQGPADQLVEEFMLAANSAVAEEILEKHIAGLFRIHPEPEPEKIMEFSEFASKAFHLQIGDILSSRQNCLDFLASIPNDHRKPVLISMFLRSLPRASYVEEPQLHYGLGKFRYAHFTSPIRRYADLSLHQQLLALDLNKRLRSRKTFAALGTYLSHQEENNDNAYFAATDRLKLHYLKQQGALENGTLYEAVISKITSGGLLCDITELGLYGFVPVSYLRGGHYRRSRGKERASADHSHTQYRVGDFVYLTLDSLDFVRGTALFRPAL